jgi:hypothetical protein
MASLSPQRVKAHLIAGMVSVIAAVPLGTLWLVLYLHLYLEEGGTLGGYGAAPDPGEAAASFKFQLILYAASVLLIVGVLGAYVLTLRRMTRSTKAAS